jgi:hypothetical protein
MLEAVAIFKKIRNPKHEILNNIEIQKLKIRNKNLRLN